MQNPVRGRASVTLPESEPLECPDSYWIERQNQKKVVLVPLVWQSSCKLLRVSPFLMAGLPDGIPPNGSGSPGVAALAEGNPI
jgi:hypothetical protein